MKFVKVKKYFGLCAFVAFFFLTTSGDALAYSDTEVNNLVENIFNRIYIICLISLLFNFILILVQVKRRKVKINSYQFVLSVLNSLVCVYLSLFVFWKEAIFIDYTNSNSNGSDFTLILINIVLGILILIFNYIYINKGEEKNEN